MAGVMVRPGSPCDLEAIARIQQRSFGASQWDPEGYLAYEFLVAICDGVVAGFIVVQPLAAGECEILNLAVAPEYRRRGLARSLVSEIQTKYVGPIFLEVRASNAAARQLYENVGFTQVGQRPDYYRNPSECAIVMKFHSC